MDQRTGRTVGIDVVARIGGIRTANGRTDATTQQGDGMNSKLPCPRLEFRWAKNGDSWTDRRCTYSLVIALEPYDIRGNLPDDTPNPESSEMSVKLGETKCTGGKDLPPIHDGIVDTPFRDGVHAQWDCRALGGHIPIVAVCDDYFSVIALKPKQK